MPESDKIRTLVQLLHVSKSFPGVNALVDVDIELRAGSIHALLGENGAGKSTLINILSGVLRPDAGDFLLHGRRVRFADARQARAAGIATVHQEADLFPDLTVAENIALERNWPRRAGLIDWRRLKQSTRDALEFLGSRLAPDQQAVSLTAAERQLVGIAAAMHGSASVIILDEPTSSLSQADTHTLFAHLKEFRDRGGAILYVSHRLEEIFQLADVATVLRDGQRIWHGPMAGVTAGFLISQMVGRETVEARTRPHRSTSHAATLSCTKLTASDGSFRDVTLSVRTGEVLGVYGLIGAGRSEWAQAVFGLRKIAAGQITLSGRAWSPRSPGNAIRHGLAYLPEDRLRMGLFAGLSVRANSVISRLRRLGFGPFTSASRETERTKDNVRQLSIRLHSILQPAGTLSGGNQQKLILGRWLACEPQILILDEPTRGVDVGAKAEIHQLMHGLADSGKAVVLISSDLPEVLAQSDRIGVFREGCHVATFERGTMAEELAASAMPASTTAKGSDPAPTGRPALRGTTWLREAGLIIAVIFLTLFLSWRTDTFWKAGTLQDVAENAALLTISGLAAAMVILSGGIDISFGSIMALGGAVTGWLMHSGRPPIQAVPAGLAVSAIAGAVNATLTLLGRVHPIVVTLGTMSAYRGLVLLLIGPLYLHDLPDSFRAPLRSLPLGVPMAVWLAVFVVGLAWFALGWTVAGRQAIALGSNPKAAERTGIHRWKVWLAMFTLHGLLAGVAGILALGLAGNMHSTDFEEKTLEAIGVAVVGGIAITGGRGSVWGIWAAALMFRLLEKGWVLLHISSYWQKTIVGSLLLMAVLTDQLFRRANRSGD